MDCGSQCYLCDLPIHFDTYEGCSHACEYCFAKKFKDIRKIKTKNCIKSLEKFINGERTLTTNWCDWKIPLHWGGVSDPFQSKERLEKVSLECLKILSKYKYPFIVSTKSTLPMEKEYLDLLSQCNVVLQFSMACSSYDKIEPGAPSFEERLKAVEKCSKRVTRVIIRIQPYMHEHFEEIKNNIKRFAQAGAYGIIVEGMKYKNKNNMTIKIGNDNVYPYNLILLDFLKLKEEAHKYGLKIYAGENRIRKYGDSLTCCGIDGLKDFTPNKFNLNHLLNGDKQLPSSKMKEKGTGSCFKSINRNTIDNNESKQNSFAFNMVNTYKKSKRNINDIMGVSRR